MLIDKVKKEKADLGIAYDGDADRIGAVDERGNILWGDELLVLFARDVLKRNPARRLSPKLSARNAYTTTFASAAASRSCGKPAIR
jgi:phosphomannomutase